MKKLMLIMLALAVLVAPVMALETLTKDNFDTPETQVTPEKDYYFPGDALTVEYRILPKTDEDMKLIGGEDYNTPRAYTFKTSLEDPHWTIAIRYNYGSAIKSEDFTGSKVKLDVYGLVIEGELKGVKYIEVNMTGKVPSVTSRLETIDVINVSIEDAEEDALPPLQIKVVNTQKFGEDIQKVRADADSLKSDLEAAGVQYNQSDFDEIYSLLDDAQSLVSQGKYLEADEKITQAEEKLNEIAAQADKLKAETERDYVEDLLNKAYLNLSVTEIALNKVAESKNYSTYVETYAELKSQYDSLKSQFDDANQMITDKKYSEAYEKLKELKPQVENLLSSIIELKTKIENEKPEEGGGLSLPTLQLSLPFSPLYLAAGVVVVVVAVVAALKLRGGRRKWDELR
ncbi:hypothetical protein AFULGI_00010350 [Archaeoglobus fulgidus DSM 8774]|uniref:Uncharacterized protein n=2 Tax=Archaeoglobus fulgidus TaxID=2234 RepID=A0A075WJQ8_ARCFL|nr:hypothetical protein [Archaeoglobus fulgidus]AIG97818.1 hypothetical protein AFULGI_00010350 [Archaeoglobus fulgidus DSM 8774]